MDSTFYLPQTVNIPMPLYKAMKGRYFTGCADSLDFTGEGACAWCSLYNPAGSGVNLHVNEWTASSASSAFRAQVCLDASMPGEPNACSSIAAVNLSLNPLPQPKAQLLYASGVKGEPQSAVLAAVRYGLAGTTVAVNEQGKFILPPESSFCVLLSSRQVSEATMHGCVTLGWWEEPVPRMSYYGSRSQRSYPRDAGPSGQKKLPQSED